MGAVDTLLVDIDDVIPGTVDDADGDRHVRRRTGRGQLRHRRRDRGPRLLLSGARVLGVRRADIPGGASLAAILRYPF